MGLAMTRIVCGRIVQVGACSPGRHHACPPEKEEVRLGVDEPHSLRVGGKCFHRNDYVCPNGPSDALKTETPNNT